MQRATARQTQWVPEYFSAGDELVGLVAEAPWLSSWSLAPRQLCDLELLLNGGFFPLRGFLGRDDYESVLSRMRLAGGTLWPIPITLDVSRDFARRIAVGERIALRDAEGALVAILDVTEMWEPNRLQEAQAVLGSGDRAHCGVRRTLDENHPIYVGGPVTGVEPPEHFEFEGLWAGPNALRRRFAELGWHRVVGFQTRNPVHRAHFEITLHAAEIAQASLLLHPAVGPTQEADVDYATRVRCYRRVLARYPPGRAMLAILPLAMRMAGPREAVWHAIIRRNYGCTHFIVGRDHAGPVPEGGLPFYGPYEAQELARSLAAEIGIEILPFSELVYVEKAGEFVAAEDKAAGERAVRISGTELRRRLAENLPVPDWFSFPEVLEELRNRYPPKIRHGVALFLTGLPGAGKSTIARAVAAELAERSGRKVTLLDGDIVRKHLSSELGYSREHRDLNIARIGFVANEIVRHGGIAICAAIAPYREARNDVRAQIERNGRFYEIYVSTPVEVCERRDRKGLYARARRGLMRGFTGIDDPYEAPARPEITIDASESSARAAALAIIERLEEDGYLAAGP